MSWYVNEKIGRASKVRDPLAAAFDNAAIPYKGKSEEGDVLAAKGVVLSWLDQQPADQGVKVGANGSRSDYSVSVTISATRVDLVL